MPASTLFAREQVLSRSSRRCEPVSPIKVERTRRTFFQLTAFFWTPRLRCLFCYPPVLYKAVAASRSRIRSLGKGGSGKFGSGDAGPWWKKRAIMTLHPGGL